MSGAAQPRSFPRRYAATQRFTLGAPRSLAIAPDGSRVVFVRSRAGDDPVGCLWVLDTATGAERCIADPRDLAGDDDLPPEERARRERAREGAGGIVSYATDRQVTAAVFALGSAAYVADLVDGGVTALAARPPVIAPRLDPAGSAVAFVQDRALWVLDLSSETAQRVTPEAADAVSWGLPDFVAAEEMGRFRGYWWSPDGTALAVARVDETPVATWHIADATNPQAPPVEHRYPAAGTANADVSLHVARLDGSLTEVDWGREELPYLASVSWGEGEPLTVVAQSRDQQRLVVCAVDDAGGCRVVHEQVQRPWVELIAGLPAWLVDGRLVTAHDDPDTRRLAVDGAPVTPPGLQVRRLLHAGEHRLIFAASGDGPTSVAVWSCAPDGSDLKPLTRTDGVADGVAVDRATVVVERSLASPEVTTTVRGNGGRHVITSHAERPPLTTNARELTLGDRDLRAVLLLPHGHDGKQPLPVLLDPYGGPHAQRVLRSHNSHLQSQWFADAGFAVLVVDGRGTPGRGPAWEHAIAGDLAEAPLQDQVDALQACAAMHPGLLDLDRVAIKGWSFGGFLAALAVLRRPDVFHAAVAGAPVTDWSLYDTHYTERYLGTDTAADSYKRCNLLAEAHRLERPLLLIHGLTDDNVVAAHTLRLSQALLEAGRPHAVLPLSGVTHMTPQEVVAENLLMLELRFLQDALGRPIDV
ncbi:MAG TPA: prolyl oligopeptidase family serine peptidase [Egibacteraceae bacterium]|nr:prolyl oligopeptidase family serine peptidase [Egibacteraceae bacterium]